MQPTPLFKFNCRNFGTNRAILKNRFSTMSLSQYYGCCQYHESISITWQLLSQETWLFSLSQNCVCAKPSGTLFPFVIFCIIHVGVGSLTWAYQRWQHQHHQTLPCSCLQGPEDIIGVCVVGHQCKDVHLWTVYVESWGGAKCSSPL